MVFYLDNSWLKKFYTMKRMRACTGALLLTLFSSICLGQKTDTLVKKLDSLSRKTDSAGGQVNNVRQEAYNENTKINFKTYFILLGSDFKQQVTAPFHTTTKDWIKVGKFAAVTVAIGLFDEPIQQHALQFRTDNQVVRTVSNYTTNLGAQYEGMALVALGGYGFIFNNEKI